MYKDYYDVMEEMLTDDIEVAKGVQKMINEGKAWCFEGSYGREMARYIDAGYCLLGRKSFYDYYGNKIPSRYEVKEGSEGSYQYVKKLWGKKIGRASCRERV